MTTKPRKNGSCWEGTGQVVGQECELCGMPIDDKPLVRWTFPHELTPYTVNAMREDGNTLRSPLWIVWTDCHECDYPVYLPWCGVLPVEWGPWRRASKVMELLMSTQPVFRQDLADGS